LRRSGPANRFRFAAARAGESRDLGTLVGDEIGPQSTLRLGPDSVVVVSTASRGLGLEFVRQLLERTPAQVVALHRLAKTGELELLQQQHHERLRMVAVDLEDQTTVEAAGAAIQGMHSRVDLLLNVAGILGDGKSKATPGPERSITGIDREWLTKTFEVNLIGHVMMTQALWPLLKRDKAEAPSKVVNLSARVGSISDNKLGGWYSYRMSKASINMFTKTLSLEAKRINCAVLSLHPGTVDTDLSKPFQGNVAQSKLFTPQHSVACMLDVVGSITDAKDGGKFFAYDGSEIPF